MHRAILAALSSIMVLAAPGVAAQEDGTAKTEPVQVKAHGVADVFGVVAGGEDRGVRALVEGDVTLTADLGHYLDVPAFQMGAQLLGVTGGQPNKLAGTLQGVNSIEVQQARVKLYQLWLSKGLFGDRISVLAGLFDLNTEFYQNDAVALLVAPAFSIGSELAASGPNGPSIFPSTALTVRLGAKIGHHGYARAAIVNADSGVMGDDGSSGSLMRDGVLLIGEAGIAGDGKLALGVWRYSKRQRTVGLDPADDAVAKGAYVLAEHRLHGDDAHHIDVFLRAGISDGRTTTYKGGYQLGLLASGVLRGRPASQLSFGMNGAVLAHGFRADLTANGIDSARQERGFELTYRDNLTSHVSIQPDVQYIRRSYVDQGESGTWVVGVRITAQM